jgi:membrane-bound serine protease (ClpP class)
MALLVISLLVVSLVLLLAEVLVIPGFGVTGILGIALGVGGVVLAFQSLGALWGSLSILWSVLLTVLLVWVLPKTAAGRGLVLGSANAGKVASGELDRLLSKRGVALTPLRPAGTVEIEGQRVDVVSEGELIEVGSPILVVEVQGTRVVVRAERT